MRYLHIIIFTPYSVNVEATPVKLTPTLRESMSNTAYSCRGVLQFNHPKKKESTIPLLIKRSEINTMWFGSICTLNVLKFTLIVLIIVFAEVAVHISRKSGSGLNFAKEQQRGGERVGSVDRLFG